jgi:hypoxanthine-guanine phosphoribosyltransferase
LPCLKRISAVKTTKKANAASVALSANRCHTAMKQLQKWIANNQDAALLIIVFSLLFGAMIFLSK